jgi:BASS family bile acid:Na+ symporter
MNDIWMTLLKISLVIFMAGNLLDMGLRLNPQDALRGLRNGRFVAYTLLWGFVFCPALAYVITRVIPLASPYATGLILMGMTPCAPFLPALVNKAKGDLGYTAAFMLLAAAGTVVFMPFAVPLMAKGLTASAWTIAKPLLLVVLLPLAGGMAILRASAAVASKIQPSVKKVTAIATLAMAVLAIIVYGKDLLGVRGSLAVISQAIFFLIVNTLTYWCGFGLQPGQKIVLSAGMATRNCGAALAPLLSMAETDQRAIVMVVLGIPMMAVFGFLAAKWFGRPPSADETGSTPAVPGQEYPGGNPGH